MTPSEIKSIFAKIGGGANKLLGQHFLIDDGVLNAIVEAADVQNGERVLEVGPGLGVLTQALLKRGAEVTAIEKDARFVEYLGSIASAPRVVQGDAARLDWNKEIGDGPWKFVSNLPYSISSLALRKALWTEKPPKVIVVLVQKEVAQRAVDRRKTSLLSLMVALASREAEIVQIVPQGAFFPAPKVESAILKIVPMPAKERMTRWGMDPEKIMEIAKQGFAHPRKFLKSNLKKVLMHDHKILQNCGISEKARAEELSPEDWARLAREVENSR